MNILTEVVPPILSTAGVGALLAGLAGYLKVSSLAWQQAHFSKELEHTKGEVQRGLEDVKLNTERLKFAHAKQFEKEFKLYEELWEHLWNLMNHATRLGDAYITREDKIARNQEQVLAALEPVARFTENFAPFFHERVHRELKTFVDMCTEAWVNNKFQAIARLGEPAACTSEEIERQLQRICEEIRCRIGLSDIQWYPPNPPLNSDAPPSSGVPVS